MRLCTIKNMHSYIYTLSLLQKQTDSLDNDDIRVLLLVSIYTIPIHVHIKHCMLMSINIVLKEHHKIFMPSTKS